jgi:CDP-diacylglycerol--serine O-phosphatidyltransferase
MQRLRLEAAMSIIAGKKPFAMIREFHLGHWFTLGNAICGTAAIFAVIGFVETAMSRHIYFAAALVLAADLRCA